MSHATWMFERNRTENQLAGHYLDSAATAQMLCVSHDAMTLLEQGLRANVRRGSNRLVERSDELYEQSRLTIARFLGTSGEQVVFTSGATAALNLLAHSFSEQLGAGDEIVVSELEHHSNFVPWQQAARRSGASLNCWPVTADGVLDMSVIDRVITTNTRVIAVTQVSNVTGLATDLAPIARRARAVGAVLVVDAAQGVPHGLVAEHADFLVFSGHKVFGPTGIGVLAGRHDGLKMLQPASFGGGMVAGVGLSDSSWADLPWRLEAGTPPFSQALGLAAAIEWLRDAHACGGLEAVRRLTRVALDELLNIPGISVIGPPDQDRLGIISFTVAGVHAHDVAQVLDDNGVWVRAGQMCAQPLMWALGLGSVVRVSFGPYNTRADVDALLRGLDQAMTLGCA